ncbi:SDR family oxidoreductase [Sporichthya brevicatena]|uniref:SDR family oxidoreductase n=1 Tax=Sporichthya brevicatena TaxID=171442 RepID=A0ABN1GBQ7_9ACTN
MTRSTALVTGAGAGTGREYVKLLLAEGATVVAVSLLKTELDDLAEEMAAGDRLVIHQADLSEPDAAERLVEWCDEQSIVVDTLINNAGFAVYGMPTEVDLDRVETMIGLNVVTCLKLSVLFARRMRERGRGRILVMGSTAGMAPTPRLGAYCATKAFTNTFAWSLGAELRGTGVTMTVVTPGGFRSKFADTAGVSGPALLTKVYEREKLDAASVARKAFAAMRAGKPTVTVGSSGQVAKFLSRIVPPTTMARLLRSM